MAARERILKRIRRAQGRGDRATSAAEREVLDSYLGAHPRGSLPEIPTDERIARFCDRARAAASSWDRVPRIENVPAAVRRYLDAQQLPTSGCVWPDLARLDWAGAGLSLAARAAQGDDAIGVTGAFCAIAETGTLMLVSGPGSPASVSLLPETHVAVVPVGRIVAHMEDGWDLARAELRTLPRAVNFISGPSRTADIEQTLVLGAHGPYRVHIVLIG
jgi:L-lactate dehydrogenase complex protein LldG